MDIRIRITLPQIWNKLLMALDVALDYWRLVITARLRQFVLAEYVENIRLNLTINFTVLLGASRNASRP